MLLRFRFAIALENDLRAAVRTDLESVLVAVHVTDGTIRFLVQMSDGRPFDIGNGDAIVGQGVKINAAQAEPDQLLGQSDTLIVAALEPRAGQLELQLFLTFHAAIGDHCLITQTPPAA